jgi:hypothetical protein
MNTLPIYARNHADALAGVPLPPWHIYKNFRTKLLRAAWAIRDGMAKRGLETKEVAPLIKPGVTLGALHGWMGARNACGPEHREWLGRHLHFDPNLLLPEDEDKVEKATRERADLGRHTLWRNRAILAKARAKDAAKAQPAQPTPPPSPETAAPNPPSAAPAPNGDICTYTHDGVTMLTTLHVLVHRPQAYPELLALFDLIQQELADQRAKEDKTHEW